MLLRKTLINSFAEKEYHDTDKLAATEDRYVRKSIYVSACYKSI